MGSIAKYNIFKGVSTVLTIGTPIITLLCTNSFFRTRSTTAISAAGILGILIVLLFAKDKIAEKFKFPGAFPLCLGLLILLYLVEHIVVPMKYVLWTSTIAAGLDTITFKVYYKQQEALLPPEAQAYKHFGFIFATKKMFNAKEA